MIITIEPSGCESVVRFNPSRLTDDDLACLWLMIQPVIFTHSLRLGICEFVHREITRRESEDPESIELSFCRVDAARLDAPRLACLLRHAVAIERLAYSGPEFADRMSDAGRDFARRLVNEIVGVVGARLAQGFGGVK